MKNTMINVLAFAAGAAIGSLVTWKVVKTKYERIAQEEIDSVKEYWARRMINEVLNEETSDHDENEPVYDEEDWSDEWHDSVVTDYNNIARQYRTVSDEDVENDEEGEGEDDFPYINAPYVITPQDFADGNYDYAPYSLTYYCDGVLADDWDVVQDIEETIGEESLAHFGDFADDVVHVRNERLQADYEVVKDPRPYSEILKLHSPTQMNENRRPD